MRLPPRPWLRLDPGCVVSYCPLASSIGARVLREGGNAVDAAVATGLALTVTYPQAGNIGGGGFLMLHTPSGEVHFLDYRETAPAKVKPEDLLSEDGRLSNRSVLGGMSVGVPGTVAGFAAALEKFGSMAWDRIVAMVIPLAESGVWLTTRQATCLDLYRESLSHFESTRRYFTSNGVAPAPGTLFVQSDLAATLRELAEQGPRAFYEGSIARKIAKEIAEDEGVLDLDDLAGYQPKWRQPLHRKFLDWHVFTPSLPSAGALVVQLTLGLLESQGIREMPRDSVERHDLLARAFRVAFGFEHRMSGDPDFLDPARVEQCYGEAESDKLREDLALLESRLPAQESLRGTPTRTRSNTTHFCVIDKQGMAVSNTYSLNTMFGSKLAVGGAGFLLNNGLDDFRIAANVPNWYDLLQGDRNQLRPGYRPVSSMTPTIVVSRGKVEIVLGGSGGPRIPTAVVQTLLGVLSDRTTLGDAMRAPRVHHQLFPDETAIEMNVPERIATGLAAKGHNVVRVPQLGIEAGIRRDPVNDEITAILDTRFGDFW
jgi:gamma-glutamyltranspeptidase/glutathione hydrolase